MARSAGYLGSSVQDQRLTAATRGLLNYALRLADEHNARVSIDLKECSITVRLPAKTLGHMEEAAEWLDRIEKEKQAKA